MAGGEDFVPDFTLLLFEEPEAFLHPDQQATLALNLRALDEKDGQQILASTHSLIFVGRSAQNLTEISQLSKPETVSQVNHLSSEQVEELFGDGRGLQCMPAQREGFSPRPLRFRRKWRSKRSSSGNSYGLKATGPRCSSPGRY